MEMNQNKHKHPDINQNQYANFNNLSQSESKSKVSRIVYFTDGGIETDLIFNQNQNLPFFSSIHLFHQQKQQVLYQYFAGYAQYAFNQDIPFVLVSPSWRASLDWIQKLSFTQDQMVQYNRKSIQLLKRVKNDFSLKKSIICGCIGPRGDGYIITNKMTVQQAKSYHKFQVKIFHQQKADQIMGMTMGYQNEALGIVLVCMDYKIPVVISFTVEQDGRLPDGSDLSETIKRIDQITDKYVKYFMINCAHPTHFKHIISKSKDRIRGIRVNSSKKTHRQLDESTQLDIGDIKELARSIKQIDELVEGLEEIGGCCGTDLRHIKQIYQQLSK